MKKEFSTFNRKTDNINQPSSFTSQGYAYIIMCRALVFIVISLFLFSCKKEVNENPESPSQHVVSAPLTNQHQFSGSWEGTSFMYSLSFFTLEFEADSNHTGFVNAIYNETGHVYAPGTLSWETYDFDSIRIYFEFDAYPEDGWLLKGVLDENDTIISGDTYYVPRTNHDDLSHPHGQFELNKIN